MNIPTRGERISIIVGKYFILIKKCFSLNDVTAKQLNPKDTLMPGQRLWSDHACFTLELSLSGNLVSISQFTITK